MSIGLIIIATGKAYVDYAEQLIGSIAYYFEGAHPIVFTDQPQVLGAVASVYHTMPLGYPQQTLRRYHTILEKEYILQKFDHLFYIDADMLFVDYVKEEDIISRGLTATLHPGFFKENTLGAPEKREISTACCSNNIAYYCGGFQGGTAKAYLDAANFMASKIDVDTKNGVTAIWHDESHWNALLANRPPDRILSPSFCYPEDYDGGYGWSKEEYPAKLIALDKRKRGNHPRYPNES